MKKARGKQAGSDAARGASGERDAQTNATAAGRKADAGSARWRDFPPGICRNLFNDDLLPADGRGYVEAVHRMVDMVSVTDDLLRSEDEKLKQKVLEQLLELAYGRHSLAAARGNEEELPASWNLPRPRRD